jgi:hypothetical protein
MKFHVHFTYESQDREKVLRFLESGGLSSDAVKVKGAWIAAETGFGFAILEADDAKPLYELCAEWSEYGQLQLTPLISVRDL